MEKRELTCIGCPMGCAVTVEMNGREIVSITGYTCKRGKIYAEKEVTAPTRIVTTTVRVAGGVRAVVPVKTSCDIPKDKIFACIAALKNLEIKAPVVTGAVVVKHVAGTDADIIAVRAVPEIAAV